MSADALIEQVKLYYPTADEHLLEKAYEFAVRAHEGQLRKSGDPYVTHPISVASVITKLRLGVPSICAGLLHDAVEDTSATVEELTVEFGAEIAFLVDGVTKLGQLPYSNRKERQAENFRKMLLAMAKDIRVILVKLCDRLDNMRTLGPMPPAKQERIAAETMDIYAPLAHRLGIQWIKSELEDLSFKYLHPGEYERVAGDLNRKKKDREDYIAEVEQLILSEMNNAGIQCRVSGRAKNLWSIRQKMKRTGQMLEDIHDSIGFRVITAELGDCYGCLGVAHAKWTPIPGRFKDYIALPKPNMYQSLHTTVIGPKGERIEIQVRTDEMHLVAEQGIAAHWKYKEGRPDATNDEKKFAWLKRLMESQQAVKDPTEFIESVKVDLFAEEVYVFTPEGDVKGLPKGSCPIDFAYSVHSNVGDHCSGARVNGMMVPLRYKLRNGDTVEIITSPHQKPNKDWLKLVSTSRARTKIRHRLRREEREKAIELGRGLIDKALRSRGISYARASKQGDLLRASEKLRAHGVEELICQLGYGRLTPSQILEAAFPDEEAVPKQRKRAVTEGVPFKQESNAIIVQGESNIMVRFGRCCSPLPGDNIVGYITRGRGVTVHLLDCNKALDLDPDRRIDVEWGSGSGIEHQVSIQVYCANQPGLLAHISQAFLEAGVNINQAHCKATEDGRAVNTFQASVKDLAQLKKVTQSLTRIKGVFGVERVPSKTK